MVANARNSRIRLPMGISDLSPTGRRFDHRIGSGLLRSEVPGYQADTLGPRSSGNRPGPILITHRGAASARNFPERSPSGPHTADSRTHDDSYQPPRRYSRDRRTDACAQVRPTDLDRLAG